MFAAIVVLSAFAAAWAIGAIVSLGWPLWLIAVPLIASAGLILAARRAPPAPRNRDQARRIGRTILWWSLVEFTAIVVVGNLLEHFHLDHAVTPAIAIIVGLHFVPLARGTGFPAYYATAAGIVLLGTIALFLPPPVHLIVTAFGSAFVLWGTALLWLRVQNGRAPLS